jgi:predicted transcriptional regulator
MPKPEDTKSRRPRPRADLSIFEEELNVPFNKAEFLPDLPPHARAAVSELKETWAKVKPKLSQPQRKHEPNLGQSEAKVEPKKAKVEPKKAEVKPKLSQSEAKVEPELRPQVEPKLSQSEAKVEPKQPLSMLIGLQRNVLLYVYESCRAEGAKISAPISIENLATALRTTVSAARKATQRVEQKGYVTRAKYKDGRGGWTQYSIPDGIYNALLLEETRAKVEPKLSQSKAKVEPELEPQLRPKLSSSSGSDLDLKTTKTSESDDALPENWAVVDTTLLSEIGFTQTHLRQLHRAGLLTPEEAQDSIYAFAFDLEVNGKAKRLNGSPLNFFMGCLRRGPYAPPENFEPPEVRQRRLYLEAKQKAAKARRELEEKLEALEFEEWCSKLSFDERTRLVPATEFAKVGSTAHNVELRRYFREQVLPSKSLEQGENYGPSESSAN